MSQCSTGLRFGIVDLRPICATLTLELARHIGQAPPGVPGVSCARESQSRMFGAPRDQSSFWMAWNHSVLRIPPKRCHAIDPEYGFESLASGKCDYLIQG